MKLNFLKSSGSILLIPLVTLALASGAQACNWDDANCKVNEIKNAANNQAKQIRNDANNQANQIRNDANNQAKKITDDANSYAANLAKQAPIDAANIVANANRLADKIRTAAVAYVANSADISAALYGDLVSQAVTAYSQSSSQIVNGYNTTVAEVNALETAAQDLLFRTAGAEALKQNGAKLSALQSQLTHLDREGQAAINRILRAIATGNLDDQGGKDLQSLAMVLGLWTDAGNDMSHAFNIPSNTPNSNFSICIGGNGTYVGGAYASFCFAIELTPSKTGKHKMAVVENLGLTIGYGLGVGGSISWSPGSIADNEGVNTGFQAAVPGIPPTTYSPAIPPFDVGLSWNLPTSHKEVLSMSAKDAIPSFSFGLGAGTPINNTINVGGTFVIKKL